MKVYKVDVSNVNTKTLKSSDKTDFGQICKKLNVNLKKPGWPDKFGEMYSQLLVEYQKKPIRTLSLFSGAGGLDIGFHDCGFEVLEMIEVEDKFVDTLKLNIGPDERFGSAKARCIDIRDFEPSKGTRVDFILGGPPCQTFSAAGRRASGVMGTDDDRGNLFKEYVRILETLKPKAFLFENVYGITGAQGGQAWREIQEAFESAGYSLSYRVLDAADYGVPQHRERLFIVGNRLKSYFKFPEPTHGPDSPSNAPFYTAGNALGTEDLMFDEKLKELDGRYGYLLKDIPPGLNYSFFTEKMGHPTPIFAWRSKFSDFLYKADPEVPVRTIKAQGGKYTGPFHWRNRPFSKAELKRLQTFPDSYEISGGKSKVIHQIGNSVPPQLARMLAIAIANQFFYKSPVLELLLMENTRELGFRTRKRLLTERYQDKAQDAINNIRTNKRHKLVRVLQSGFVSLDEKFRLNFSTKEESEYSYEIDTKKSPQHWVIAVKSLSSRATKPKFDLLLKSDKIYPEKSLVIQLTGTDIFDGQLTVAVKLLEKLIKDEKLREDIVQLVGYYQYPCELEITAELHSSDQKLSNALNSILSGSATRLTEPYRFFADAWGCKVDEVITISTALRDMGYEIRNSGTNPQIPEGHLLVPYELPTLNHRSVQLNKQLKV